MNNSVHRAARPAPSSAGVPKTSLGSLFLSVATTRRAELTEDVRVSTKRFRIRLGRFSKER
jgi:hypothetical protein